MTSYYTGYVCRVLHAHEWRVSAGFGLNLLCRESFGCKADLTFCEHTVFVQVFTWEELTRRRLSLHQSIHSTLFPWPFSTRLVFNERAPSTSTFSATWCTEVWAHTDTETEVHTQVSGFWRHGNIWGVMNVFHSKCYCSKTVTSNCSSNAAECCSCLVVMSRWNVLVRYIHI